MYNLKILFVVVSHLECACLLEFVRAKSMEHSPFIMLTQMLNKYFWPVLKSIAVSKNGVLPLIGLNFLTGNL